VACKDCGGPVVDQFMWHSIVWKDCPAGEQAPLVLPAHVPTVPAATTDYRVVFDDDYLPVYSGYQASPNSFWYAYNKLKEFIVKNTPSVTETK
jgi:hypothetical protein